MDTFLRVPPQPPQHTSVLWNATPVWNCFAQQSCWFRVLFHFKPESSKKNLQKIKKGIKKLDPTETLNRLVPDDCKCLYLYFKVHSMFHYWVLQCHPIKRSDLETSVSRTAELLFTGNYFEQLRPFFLEEHFNASHVNKCYQLKEEVGAKNGHVLPNPDQVADHAAANVSIYVKLSHWGLCLCLGPFQFFATRFLLTKQRFPGLLVKSAPSNTTTKSNRAWISPLFMTPETHFNLVTQLLDFLCRSDDISLFPCHLISISLDLLPPLACLLPWYHLHFSPSSVRLLTEMTCLSF